MPKIILSVINIRDRLRQITSRVLTVVQRLNDLDAVAECLNTRGLRHTPARFKNRIVYLIPPEIIGCSEDFEQNFTDNSSGIFYT